MRGGGRVGEWADISEKSIQQARKVRENSREYLFLCLFIFAPALGASFYLPRRAARARRGGHAPGRAVVRRPPAAAQKKKCQTSSIAPTFVPFSSPARVPSPDARRTSSARRSRAIPQATAR